MKNVSVLQRYLASETVNYTEEHHAEREERDGNATGSEMTGREQVDVRLGPT